MATFLDASLVQQWLERTKLTVGTVPDKLDQTSHDVVFGRVAQVYDTSVWVDADTTPSLILEIQAMLVAAWMYEALYSEDLELNDSNYGVRLEARAMMLLDGIVNKSILLPDAPDGSISSSSEVVFFPTDLQETDGEGSEIKFKMGTVF